MKCILLLSLVALCYSYPYGTASTYGTGRNINIDQDGTIVIREASGKSLIIRRALGVNGEKKIELILTDPNTLTKRLQIDDDSKMFVKYMHMGIFREEIDDSFRTMGLQGVRTQMDILMDIFKGHQGMVDDITFEDMLRKVYHFVESGKLNVFIYNMLRKFQIQHSTGQQEFFDDQNMQMNMMRYNMMKQNLMKQNMIRQYLMGQNMMGQSMMGQDTMGGNIMELMGRDMMGQNMMDKNMMYRNIMLRNLMDKNLLSREMMDTDMMDKETMDKNMIYRNMMDNNMMYRNAMDKNMMYKNMMDRNMMDKLTMDKNMMYRNMMDKETMDKNMMYRNMMDKNMMYRNMMDKETMDKNMMYRNMMDKETMDKNMMYRNMMDKNLMYRNVMDNNMIDKYTMDKNMMYRNMMDKNMMYKNMMDKDMSRNIMDKNMIHRIMMDKNMMNKDNILDRNLNTMEHIIVNKDLWRQKDMQGDSSMQRLGATPFLTMDDTHDIEKIDSDSTFRHETPMTREDFLREMVARNLGDDTMDRRFMDEQLLQRQYQQQQMQKANTMRDFLTNNYWRGALLQQQMGVQPESMTMGDNRLRPMMMHF